MEDFGVNLAGGVLAGTSDNASNMAEEEEVSELASGVVPSGKDVLSLLYKKPRRNTRLPSVQEEVAAYLNLPLADIGDVDPLAFWSTNAEKYPVLSRAAERVLVIMPSSAEVERQASTGGLTVTPLRSNLTPDHVDQLVMLARNLHAELIPDDVIVAAFEGNDL